MIITTTTIFRFSCMVSCKRPAAKRYFCSAISSTLPQDSANEKRRGAYRTEYPS